MAKNISITPVLAYIRSGNLIREERDELHARVLAKMSELSISVIPGIAPHSTKADIDNATGNVKALRDWIDDADATQTANLQQFEDAFSDHLDDNSSSQTSSSSVTSSSSSSSSSAQSV